MASPPSSPSAGTAAAAPTEPITTGSPSSQRPKEEFIGSPTTNANANATGGATTTASGNLKLLGAWPCWYCSKLNHPVRWFCFSCNEYRRPPQLAKGAWKCRRTEGCVALNHEIRRRCFKCEADRDDPNWAYPPGPWTCLKCNGLNHPVRRRCFRESCDADRPLYECKWFCAMCERSNFGDEANCVYCGFLCPQAPVPVPILDDPLTGVLAAAAPIPSEPTTSPPTTVTGEGGPLSASPPTPAELRHGERFVGGVEQMQYKGDFIVSSVHAGTVPLREFLPTLADVVPRIGDILQQCIRVVEDRQQHSNGKWPGHDLTDDEALALVLYTFDLGLSAGTSTENFYFTMNCMLRERVQEKLVKWAPYLYCLQEALKKLPNFDGWVYRGYKNAAFVREQYQVGRKIHWSAFTSTTHHRGQAVAFAGSNGAGALLQVRVFHGKHIRAFSVFEQEDEVLLHPNSKLMVTEAKEEGGLFTVTLIEERGTLTS